jgi:hypothetical protein
MVSHHNLQHVQNLYYFYPQFLFNTIYTACITYFTPKKKWDFKACDLPRSVHRVNTEQNLEIYYHVIQPKDARARKSGA